MAWWKRWWTTSLDENPSAAADPRPGFTQRFLHVLDQTLETEQTACRVLDPWVATLIIPHVEGRASRDLSTEIGPCLEKLSEQSGGLASLTWSSLVEAAPSFEPSFAKWANSRQRRALRGEVDIAFFIANDALLHHLRQVFVDQGYRLGDDQSHNKLQIYDGDLRVDIGVEALLVEALWTMQGMASIIQARLRVMPLEFAAYRAMRQAMQQRFAGLELNADDDKAAWLLRWKGQQGRCVYRVLVRQCRRSGLDEQRFLARCQFADLIHTAPVRLLAKAPQFLSAYPDSYHRDLGSYVEVLARDVDNGLPYLLKRADDPPQRLDYLHHLRRQSLSTYSFEGMAYFADIKGLRALCVIGEQALSLIVDSRLLSGLIQAAAWPSPWPPWLRLRAQRERSLLLADPEIPDSALTPLLDSLQDLSNDLFELHGDRLDLDLVMPIGVETRGKFQLGALSGHYFALRQQANQAEATASPGRAAYYTGLRYQLLRQHERALKSFLQALRFDREDGELNLLVGRGYNEAEQYDRAVPFLQRASAALPQDIDALNSLGVAYQNAGREQQALDSFERALSLDPNDVTLLVNLGRAYFANEMIAQARKTLLRALEREPELYEAHASLALLSFQDDKLQDALNHARQALASQPEDETMRELVALIFYAEEL